MIIKDVTFSGKYLVKWMNVPWFNLDTDSDLVRPGGATYDTCWTYTYGTYGVAVLSMQTNSNSGYDGQASQYFSFQFEFYPSGVMDAHLVTTGSAFQEHPYYVDAAPCNDCNYNDGGDDVIVVDYCYDCFSTYHGPVPITYETNFDEPAHDTSTYRWYMYDAKVTWPTTTVYPVFLIGAPYNAYDDGSSYRVQAWMTKCTSCTDSAYSQYTNGPWDYANGEKFNVDSGSDSIFVAVMKRNTSSGTWSSTETLTVL